MSKAGGATYRLHSIKAVESPRLREGLMVYTFHLCFDSLPPSYWWYFEPSASKLIIDCYGGEIKKTTTTALPRVGPFRKVHVTNRRTKMSLSGKQALIEIVADQGWKLRAAPARNQTIRVTASKPLSAPKLKKKRYYHLPFLISAAAGVVTVLTALIVGG
ncbi:MAG: hypothetical protein GF344_20670 [Chitinivibrionales bacterium]|nr:hypothetical protein [Chitinivibrionales bacterium]MBD3359012.1 hypothetical protein [Chitinivibrionales bacterium]